MDLTGFLFQGHYFLGKIRKGKIIFFQRAFFFLDLAEEAGIFSLSFLELITKYPK